MHTLLLQIDPPSETDRPDAARAWRHFLEGELEKAKKGGGIVTLGEMTWLIEVETSLNFLSSLIHSAAYQKLTYRAFSFDGPAKELKPDAAP